MRTKAIRVALAAILCVALPYTAKADMFGGIQISDEGVHSFYLAIGDYYNVKPEAVVVVRQRSIPDDEIPVVFFIAQRANVEPTVIVSMRAGGASWMDICMKYGVTADVFYVPVTVAPGPPYGNAYGHYKSRDKSKWKEIRLSDADIVSLVNLKFVSAHQRISPDQVVKARGVNSSFVKINHEIQKKKGGGGKKK